MWYDITPKNTWRYRWKFGDCQNTHARLRRHEHTCTHARTHTHIHVHYFSDWWVVFFLRGSAPGPELHMAQREPSTVPHWFVFIMKRQPRNQPRRCSKVNRYLPAAFVRSNLLLIKVVTARFRSHQHHIVVQTRNLTPLFVLFHVGDEI